MGTQREDDYKGTGGKTVRATLVQKRRERGNGRRKEDEGVVGEDKSGGEVYDEKKTIVE